MKRTIDDINLYTWFMDRELPSAPSHFVPVNTNLTTEAKEWILEKLTGRFSIVHSIFSTNSKSHIVYFEDPKEATFYELKWG